MKTIQFQGRPIEVEELDILHSDERWNTYQLPDGSSLEIKTVLLEACKAVSEKTPDGEPLYVAKTHNIVKVRKG